MTNIILYTTAGCHLCELADRLLQLLAQQYRVNIMASEISDDDQLLARYGIHIPVIQFADKTELTWPFDKADIETKLKQQLCLPG